MSWSDYRHEDATEADRIDADLHERAKEEERRQEIEREREEDRRREEERRQEEQRRYDNGDTPWSM